MHVHLDPLGGIAGDMFIAAILDAWPEWQDGVKDAINAAGLPPGWAVEISQRQQHAIGGRHFALRAPTDPEARRFPSGSYGKIRDRIESSTLEAVVRLRAVAILTLLAEAEAAIHGCAVEEVHFHELADWDSVADIVAAAWLIEQVNTLSHSTATWSVGPLPLGGGTVLTEHGPLPVPAPATTRLLQGFEMIDDGVGGERVTPTGAAILNHLQPVPRPGSGGKLIRSGQGLGSRKLPDRANVLRLLALDTAAESTAMETVAVITFEVDDQSGEDLAVGLDHLRAEPGVLDVVQVPVLGKKGRLASQVQLLCQVAALSEIRKRCFIETTTIGLRWRLEQRVTLSRKMNTLNDIEVKTVTRPGGVHTAKAEVAAVSHVASHRERTRQRRAAEDEVLSRENTNDLS